MWRTGDNNVCPKRATDKYQNSFAMSSVIQLNDAIAFLVYDAGTWYINGLTRFVYAGLILFRPKGNYQMTLGHCIDGHNANMPICRGCSGCYPHRHPTCLFPTLGKEHLITHHSSLVTRHSSHKLEHGSLATLLLSSVAKRSCCAFCYRKPFNTKPTTPIFYPFRFHEVSNPEKIFLDGSVTVGCGIDRRR